MILSGKVVKQEKTKELVSLIKEIETKLKLVVIQVGNNEASSKYIKNKILYANELGIDCVLNKFEDDVEQNTLLEHVDILNKDKTVHGIIIQLPLPKHLNEELLTQSINKYKDVDGFNVYNIGQTYLGKNYLSSCTSRGVINLLDYYDIDVKGKNIVIAGRSNLVGKNLALMLINKGATVTSCNSATKNIVDFTKNCDIFISAIGSAKFFTKEYFQNSNTVIIDVGINFKDGKMVGDVDFEGVYENVKAITPVPGGVGLLTVVQLMENLINAYKLQIGGNYGNDNG